MCLGKIGATAYGGAKGLEFQTEGEASFVNKHKYPYKPDLLFGHRDKTIVRVSLFNFC